MLLPRPAINVAVVVADLEAQLRRPAVDGIDLMDVDVPVHFAEYSITLADGCMVRDGLDRHEVTTVDAGRHRVSRRAKANLLAALECFDIGSVESH